MAQTILALEKIVVRYADSVILEVPSLTVERGEILALIGPNGAGKSTLLRLVGLLEYPSQGKLYFNDREVAAHNGLAIRRRMASVFQEPLLLSASVYDNAALGLRLRGINRRAAEQRVFTWLERLGIAQLAKRRARTLSGGEAQRTSLARALVLDPEVLLLDEPFSPLDPPTRDSLLLDLQGILRETGITTILVTHAREEACFLADRIAVLIDGKIQQLGSTAEVFSRPINDLVARFLGVGDQRPDSPSGALFLNRSLPTSGGG
jgi:tungstate transport system ATP-binding protein